MPKAILFDLDGTLWDRDAAVRKLWASQHAQRRDVLGHIPVKDFINHAERLDAKGTVDKRVVYRELARTLAFTVAVADELHADFDSRSAKTGRRNLSPGVEHLGGGRSGCVVRRRWSNHRYWRRACGGVEGNLAEIRRLGTANGSVRENRSAGRIDAADRPAVETTVEASAAVATVFRAISNAVAGTPEKNAISENRN